MYTVPQLLTSAGVRHTNHPNSAGGGVFLTAANQLMGTYTDLRRFQKSASDYFGWEAHHIVEDQDLDRLGVQHQSPVYAQQICVLIPNTAHSKRINSVLRIQNPTKQQVTANDLLYAYRDAYWLIGDYCGGGEQSIRDELMNIVVAVFRSAGI